MAKQTGIDESQLESYANQMEGPGDNVIEAKPLPGFGDKQQADKEEALRQQKPKRKSLEEAQKEAREDIEEMKAQTGLGYIEVPLEHLLSCGYPYLDSCCSGQGNQALVHHGRERTQRRG